MSKIILKVGVLASYNERLLLIKELNPKSNKYYWNIVKGTFDPAKDRSILDTARREMEEEVGVKNLTISGLQGVMIKTRNDSVSIQINLLAKLENDQTTLSSRKDQDQRGEDICETKFYTKDELKLVQSADLMNERTAVAIQEWLDGKESDMSILKFFD